ncbi:Zn-ribbon domain-containing OB-fold protein [Ramlibacter sp.]|uniref:Zn-ribbon domain-containing OB-fold protein n=1 Tax=Ramlibacter sp. TaxID=1917967 RepID=UPI003D0AB310
MSSVKYEDGWPQPHRIMDAEPYWAALQEDRLTYQRCDTCTQAVWPPHGFCPHCSGRSLTWHTSKGKGKVYSHSTVVRGPTATWQKISPYTVGFVEMDEGYYLFTQFLAKPDDVVIGKRVEVRYEKRGTQTQPLFALVDQ